MFDESFNDYKKRIKKYTTYQYTGLDLVIFLLWEVIEILWHIGKHLHTEQRKEE